MSASFSYYVLEFKTRTHFLKAKILLCYALFLYCCAGPISTFNLNIPDVPLGHLQQRLPGTGTSSQAHRTLPCIGAFVDTAYLEAGTSKDRALDMTRSDAAGQG
jgi:hypothetical protein